MFRVYEVFEADKKEFFRFENQDRFECEIYVDHHFHDYPNAKSKLVIEEVEE